MTERISMQYPPGASEPVSARIEAGEVEITIADATAARVSASQALALACDLIDMAWELDGEFVRYLREKEGWRRSAYKDPGGLIHIGMGTLIDDRKGGVVSDSVIRLAALEDIERHDADLDRRWPHWRRLSPRRQLAIRAMAYQLGVPNLMEFKRMIAALEAEDWAGAHRNALDSLWAEQTPDRAKEVAVMLRDG